MPKILMENVKMVYKSNTTVLENFNLHIDDGEFLVLFGPSGCGKSTILRLLAGLERPAEGSIFFDDEIVNKKLPQERNVSMVFQNYALYSHMTVYKNIGFPLKMQKMSKEEIDKRVMYAAKLLDIEHLLNRRPRALSGGQRQRVALGRALVRNPDLFLLDEPLSNLDASMRMELRLEIIKLQSELKTTFVYVTHDQTEAMVMGDRVAVLYDGQILQIDKPQVIYDNPVDLLVAGLLGTPKMNFLPARLKEQDGKVIAYMKDIELDIGDVDSEYVGNEVLLGIRSEDLHMDSHGIEDTCIIKALYHTTEAMGSDMLGMFTLSEHELNVRIKNGMFLHKKEYPLYIDLQKLHVFDRETGKNVKANRWGNKNGLT